MSLITANTGGSTKRSTVSAIFFISYCTGNIIGPFAFKSSEAPVYTSGIIAILVAYVVEICLLAGFAVYMAFMNKKKERALLELGEMAHDDQVRALASFSDQTDMKNPFFKYKY